MQSSIFILNIVNKSEFTNSLLVAVFVKFSMLFPFVHDISHAFQVIYLEFKGLF